MLVHFKIKANLGHASGTFGGLQYDLLNVLYGCKMALRTLDFSRVKPAIAVLRERRACAPVAAWRDSLGVTAKLGAHALRSRI